MNKRPSHILPVIVLSQFAGTSLWFAGNAILPDIQQHFDLGKNAIGNITAFVQFGFIAGTLVFAIFSIADRFSPSKVFFFSSLLAALSNLCILWFAANSFELMLFRFCTGFFLAGIYPVGMKIASDWYDKGLGKALGFLVGALVLGTAFPHLLKSSSLNLSWEKVITCTSLFASIGGLLIFLFVNDGPFRKRSQKFHPKNIAVVFKSKDFRAAALGYFGHMWELYTFWAFIPVIISINNTATHHSLNGSLWSFFVIGIGGISCIAGGYLSNRIGSARVAFWSLFISGLCCICSYLFFKSATPGFLLFMMIWGISVTADSPQFSAMVAQTALPDMKGTMLTFVTCIGFAITIGSIQLLNWMFNNIEQSYKIFTILSIGPAFGLAFLYRLLVKKNSVSGG